MGSFCFFDFVFFDSYIERLSASHRFILPHSINAVLNFFQNQAFGYLAGSNLSAIGVYCIK